MKTLIFIALGLPYFLFSQSDWEGDVVDFVFEKDTITIGKSDPSPIFLYKKSEAIEDAIWDFRAIYEDNPSSSNLITIYLTSDKPLDDSSKKGYYLKLGGETGTKDVLSFGSDQILWQSQVGELLEPTSKLDIHLRITRSVDGEWGFYKLTGKNQSTLLGQVKDEKYLTARYTGFIIKHTKTTSTKYKIIDYTVSGSKLKDRKAPELLDYDMYSEREIWMKWSEPLSDNSYQNINSQICQNKCTWQWKSDTLWYINSKNWIEEYNYMYQIKDIEDTAQNILPQIEIAFGYLIMKPKIDTLIETSDTTITISYNTPIDTAEMLNKENYNSPSIDIKELKQLSDTELMLITTPIPKGEISTLTIYALPSKKYKNFAPKYSDIIDKQIYIPKQISKGDIQINEIMYQPLPNEPEYIEFVNVSNYVIDLSQLYYKSYRNTDGLYKGIYSIYSKKYLIKQGDYIVIHRQSTLSKQNTLYIDRLPSLSNEGAYIVISDQMGNTIDSLKYSPSWHKGYFKNQNFEGISLEKTNPKAKSSDIQNWTSSSTNQKNTMGQKNSHYFDKQETADGIATINSNILSYDPPKTPIEIKITPESSAHVSIYIVSERGFVFKKIVENHWIGKSEKYYWYGERDGDIYLPKGNYVVWIKILQNQEEIVERKVITVY